MSVFPKAIIYNGKATVPKSHNQSAFIGDIQRDFDEDDYYENDDYQEAQQDSGFTMFDLLIYDSLLEDEFDEDDY